MRVHPEAGEPEQYTKGKDETLRHLGAKSNALFLVMVEVLNELERANEGTTDRIEKATLAQMDTFHEQMLASGKPVTEALDATHARNLEQAELLFRQARWKLQNG